MKIPKPRVYDIVETLDFSRIGGVVRKIISKTKVLVDWGNIQLVERIKNLALVERRY